MVILELMAERSFDSNDDVTWFVGLHWAVARLQHKLSLLPSLRSVAIEVEVESIPLVNYNLSDSG